MRKSLCPGIYLEEVPGVFHPVAAGPASVAGPIGLVDSRNLPFTRGSLAVGTNPILQSDWQYVNVRPFVLFIEQSLSQGLQWAVFQPNNSVLWSRVANLIDSFLTNQWLQGSLHGKKKHEAFFVRCDSTTMTQNDLGNGRLVALVGFAPVRPAEFVVIQICIQTKKK